LQVDDLPQLRPSNAAAGRTVPGRIDVSALIADRNDKLGTMAKCPCYAANQLFTRRNSAGYAHHEAQRMSTTAAILAVLASALVILVIANVVFSSSLNGRTHRSAVSSSATVFGYITLNGETLRLGVSYCSMATAP
jgi:hypothetical protein